MSMGLAGCIGGRLRRFGRWIRMRRSRRSWRPSCCLMTRNWNNWRTRTLSFKLMVVGAHPDDECFAFGGALALAADRGHETYMLCLTDGQAATYRGVAGSGDELGRI